MKFILDASIAVKWFFSDEELHKESIAHLNSLILSPSEYGVPELFYLEVASVIAKKSSNNEAFTSKAIDCLYQLGIKTVPFQGSILLSAITIACENKLSVYDSIYLVTARYLKAKWLTADRDAVKKISKDPKLGRYLEVLN